LKKIIFFENHKA